MIGGLYTIEWRAFKPDSDTKERPGKIVMKLRLVDWENRVDSAGSTIDWPKFIYEDIIWNKNYRDYIEISHGWDMFFNTIITEEKDKRDSIVVFQKYGLKVYDSHKYLSYKWLPTENLEKESPLIQFKAPDREVKSITLNFEIKPSFYNIDIDPKINKVKSIAYYDYFTQMTKIKQSITGNNLSYELTEDTKKQIKFEDLSV